MTLHPPEKNFTLFLYKSFNQDVYFKMKWRFIYVGINYGLGVNKQN